MTGSYGTETLRNGRYRLSFTVGGLLAVQGRSIASLFVDRGSLDEPERTRTETPDYAGDAVAAREVGERIVQVRQQAVDGNVLAIRTQSANSRMVSEVLKRLSSLTQEEIRYISDPHAPMDDCRALMWVAMCRYYALVGEFASEVLRDHYLLGIPKVTREDYDRFIRGKAMWHAELEELSDTTAAKLRSNLFKALHEAGLVEQRDHTLLPSLLSDRITDILKHKPESFLFFPMAED